MIEIKNYNEGIRPTDDGNYVFDYTMNHPEDIINIQSPQLYSSEHGDKVYWFGYKFNEDASSADRGKFIKYIKGLSDKKITEKELEKLIISPLSELDKQINLYDIDCFVYPLSGRSNLVTKMVQTITRFTSRDMGKMSFEFVKSLPQDIEFDVETLQTDIGQDSNRFNQIMDYVNSVIIPSIHEEGYFSLAERVKKSKYRKYITNYLTMSEEDMERYAKLEGNNVLVVDDINTSGSTLDEILRIIGKANHTCNIFVYTLIGK